jgi:hypothetical protein
MMKKYYLEGCYNGEVEPDMEENESEQEKASRQRYEKECVGKFFEAHCDHNNGEMYSFKFSYKFLRSNALFRADVLKDLVWEVEHLYRKAIIDLHKEGEEHDGDQGRSNQLRGGEDQPQAGQDGDHPDPVHPPE